VPTGAEHELNTHWPFLHAPSLLGEFGATLHGSVPQHDPGTHALSQQVSLPLTGQAAPFAAAAQAVLATQLPFFTLHTVPAPAQSPSLAQLVHWLSTHGCPPLQSSAVRHWALMHVPAMHKLFLP